MVAYSLINNICSWECPPVTMVCLLLTTKMFFPGAKMLLCSVICSRCTHCTLLKLRLRQPRQVMADTHNSCWLNGNFTTFLNFGRFSVKQLHVAIFLEAIYKFATMPMPSPN